MLDKVKELDNAFNIPSDADDSSVNLALGALLKKFNSAFIETKDLWF